MLTFALVAGVVTALIAVSSMLPLPFPNPHDKRIAMTAAGADRFFLGFVVAPTAAALDVHGLLIGAVLGFGFSIGSALITRSYVPILVLGALLGAGVGLAYELRF